MIENLKEFKTFDKDIIINIYKYNSKKTYEKFRQYYEVKPKCETEERDFEWKKIYKNLNNNKLNSDLRVNNFKIINNGLALDIKVEKLRNLCYLCGKVRESNEHVFFECEIAKRLFEMNKSKFFNNSILEYDKKIVFYHYNLDQELCKLMSIFKIALWNLRNFIKYETSNCKFINIESFKSILYSLKYKYFK